MSVHRRVRKVGGSLGVLIPRDLAAAMGITEGSEVEMTMIGSQLVIESTSGVASDAAFQRALGAVTRNHGKALRALADFDRGEGPLVKAVGPKKG
jgi:antitoxin component of MazEF toxin-antitoxin module